MSTVLTWRRFNFAIKSAWSSYWEVSKLTSFDNAKGIVFKNIPLFLELLELSLKHWRSKLRVISRSALSATNLFNWELREEEKPRE